MALAFSGVDHCIWMLASLMRRLQRASSERMRLPKDSGVPVRAIAPSRASSSRKSADTSTAFSSLLSRLTSGAGKRAGPSNPHHASTWEPGEAGF